MATRAKAKAPARKPAKKMTRREAGLLGGRPTKFDPKYLQQVTELCLLGATDEEIARIWNVGERTINDWKKSQPGFAEAMAIGKDAADAKVAAALFKRAIGCSTPDVHISSYEGNITKTRLVRHYPPDVQACTQWLHNRRMANWRRQPDPADGSDDPPPPSKVVIEVVDGRKPGRNAKPESTAG
jgi:hypothetical protein